MKIKAIRALLYAAIKVEDDTVTLKSVGDLLQLGDLERLGTVINEALSESMPEIEENMGGIESHTDSDKWNWEWFYYLSTNLLCMSEEQFWRRTPRN